MSALFSRGPGAAQLGRTPAATLMAGADPPRGAGRRSGSSRGPAAATAAARSDRGRERARAAARRRRRRPRSELSSRVLWAIPAIGVALFLVLSGGLIFAAGLFVLGAICMHELFAMYARANPVRLAGFIALAGLLGAALYGGQYQLVLVAVLVLPLLFGMTLASPRPSVGGLAATLLGIYWIGFALAHAVLLRRLPHGEAIVIDVLVGTFLGDTGAYLGGRMFGRRPLAPSISPNKTVEGLAIGMLCAVLGVWIAGRYEEWLPGTHAIVIGVGVALAAPVGDLFESFVKREADTKDSGGLFGPHGGALDRLDAVLFTAVAGYYIWSAYVH